MGKKCPDCGAALPEDASFCPYCAKSLIEKTEVMAPRPWRKKALYGLICVLIMIVTALSGAVVHQRLLSQNVSPDITAETNVLSEPTGTAPAVTVQDSLPPPVTSQEDSFEGQDSFGGLTAKQQRIADAVTAELHSEKFAAWQASYGENSWRDPQPPKVATVLHYFVPDFEGEEMECYLVDISADVCYTDANGEAQRDSHYELFVSSDGTRVYDSITADIRNYRWDVSTFERRAAYLLWILESMIDGNYNGSGYFLNDTERVSKWSSGDLAILNSYL